MTTAEALEELKAAWRDLWHLVALTLLDTWLARKLGFRPPASWISK